MKFFLKGDWENEYTEVTKEQYITAERDAGFYSTDEDDITTGSFDGRGVSGETRED